MAAARAERALQKSERRTSAAALELSQPSPSPATTDSNVQEGPPPAKKARVFKLRGPKPQADQVEADSIAVKRPKRARKLPAALRDDQYTDFVSSPPPKPVKRAPSLGHSSGLSSLSSAPPSPAGEDGESREESPFQDEAPLSTLDGYGDFASFYIQGGDEPEKEKTPKRGRPKAENSNGKRKRASTSSKPPPKGGTEANVAKPKKSVKQPTSRRASSSAKVTAASGVPAPNLPQQQSKMPEAPRLLPPRPPLPSPPPLPPRLIQGPHLAMQPPHMPRPPPVPHHGLSTYPQIPPPYPGRHPPPEPPRPPPLPAPAPVIRFIEVPVDPKPSEPDTIAVMIDKLTSLSTTLKQFGGLPAGTLSPPPESKASTKPKSKAKEKPKPEHKPSAQNEQLDSFLDFFAVADDSDESEDAPAPTPILEPETKDFNHVLPNPGIADTPLTHGIAFIQNALKSWAQQRMTHQIMAQWNDGQARGHFQPQNNGRRQQGRSKQLDARTGGPPAVIEMNLYDTPEGLAIRKFQQVLDSGCLQANTVLPIELGRALRHLYMQIDSLINQGRAVDHGIPWHCMSYGAQFAAHQIRLSQWKEEETRRLQDIGLMQHQQHHQVMTPMGMNVHTTPTGHDEAHYQHVLELERQRSAQHAQQQMYSSSQQHPNPLELGSQLPPTPDGPLPATWPDQQIAPNGSGGPGTPDTPDGACGVDANGVPPRNHLERMKMYMPGFLPRSGQSMKFSFAPQSVDALRAFGQQAFPVQSALGPQMPNRGPMMDVPRPLSSTPAVQTSVGDTSMTDAVRSPSASNTAEDAIDLTASDGPQPPHTTSTGPASGGPPTSNGFASGFQAINKLQPAPQAQPVQDTIPEVAASPQPVTAKLILKRRPRVSTGSNAVPDGASGLQ